MERDISFKEVAASVIRVSKENAWCVAGVSLAIALGYSSLDLLASENYALNFVAGIVVSFLIQVRVVEHLLRDHVSLRGGTGYRSYGSIFVASLVGGLAILVGFVVFILPGIYLLARFGASTPYIVVNGNSGIESLRSSWHATQKIQFPIMAVFCIYVVLAIGLLALTVVVAENQAWPYAPEFFTITANLIVSLFSVFGWTLGAAVFRFAKPLDEQVGAVFS